MSETSRKPLGKRRRFEVFKRDAFTCQYCGRTPPAVVLEVDHIVPVAAGGSDDDHNLITSCFDCNRGKADGTLEAAPLDTAERAEMLRDRMDQAKAYDALLQEQREEEEAAIDEIADIYAAGFPGWYLKDGARMSIRQFLRKLPRIRVIEAMELACARMIDRERAFKYFCGVCWNMIREGEGGEKS